MAAKEERILIEFQNSRSRDFLRELLVAHQDGVYNACFQVLGRAEDAEDAAQESLLKLAEGALSARDSESFRGWICRVSFRIALNHWHRRQAIRSRESRAAMNRPTALRVDHRERIALFEAMDKLDDGERSLLLEHYFEKVTLADLGERRGVSAVAVWRRIDRAREKLKRALLVASIVATSAQVSHALEAAVPATAPASLVGEQVLTKALIGGLTVGMTKNAVTAAVAIAALVGLAVGVGSTHLLRPRDAEPARLASKLPSSGDGVLAKAPETPGPTKSASVPSAPATDPASPKDGLRKRLEKYKAWRADWKRRAASLPEAETEWENTRRIWSKLKPHLSPERSPPALGYRGCFVQCKNGVEWTAYLGIVTLRSEGKVESREDSLRQFERLVLSTAPVGLLPPGCMSL